MKRHLEYDTASNRWHFDGWELHCGDCFQVRDPSTPSHINTWIDVRIELVGRDDWYLVGLPQPLQCRQLWNFEPRRYP